MAARAAATGLGHKQHQWPLCLRAIVQLAMDAVVSVWAWMPAEADPGMEKFNLLFAEHHLSHAASAFFPSPFEESAILTVDGVGGVVMATIG